MRGGRGLLTPPVGATLPVPMVGQEEDEFEAFPLLGRGSSSFGECEGLKPAGCCVGGCWGSSLQRQPRCSASPSSLTGVWGGMRGGWR